MNAGPRGKNKLFIFFFTLSFMVIYIYIYIYIFYRLLYMKAFALTTLSFFPIVPCKFQLFA